MLTPGTLLQNRYLIVRPIGQGGMGTVYQATDQRLGSAVALKQISVRAEHLDRRTLDLVRRQFEREARLLSNLDHPALPRVSDHFTEGDGQFLVMQFIPGDDLYAMLLLRQGRGFPLVNVLDWADQLLDALDYLHTQEPPVLHRDIKPQNLKLSKRGQIMLLDFGLAKGAVGQLSTLTGTSLFAYSLPYSPLEQILRVDPQWEATLQVSSAEKVEQILRGGVDARADLYSLGATLHHLVTGRVPVDAPRRALAVWAGQADPLPTVNRMNPEVPGGMAAVLEQAVALDPHERPASAAELRRMLNEAGRARPQVSGGGRVKGDSPPTEETFAPAQLAGEETVVPARLAKGPVPPETLPVSGPQPLWQGGQLAPTRLPEPARKSKGLLWIIGGIGALLVIGTLLIMLMNRGWETSGAKSTAAQPEKAAPLPAATPTPPAGRLTPLTILAALPLTGGDAPFGQSARNGIRMATDEINASEGTTGQRVQVSVRDVGEAVSSHGEGTLRELLQQVRPDALVADPTAGDAVSRVGQSAEIPSIMLSARAATQPGEYVFSADRPEDEVNSALASFAAGTLKAKRAAVLFPSSNLSRGDSMERACRAAGVEVIQKGVFVISQRDITAELTAARGAKPDVIFVRPLFTQFARQARQLGISIPLLTHIGSNVPGYWDESTLRDMEGVYTTAIFFLGDASPAAQKFVVGYRSLYHTDPDEGAALGYDAVKLLADAAARAKTTEARRLRDALAATKGFAGATGVISFNSERAAVKPVPVLQVRGGKFIYVTTVRP